MSCIKSCSHSETIEDHRTGDVICIFCALVVDEKIMIATNNQLELPIKEEKSNAVDKYHLILIDFCINAGLPTKFALTAYMLYQKTRIQRKKNMVTNNTKDLLFAAMYVTLHNAGSSYTLKEISAHSNTNVKTLSRLTKVYFDEDMMEDCYPSATDLVQRLCANLQINRKKAIGIHNCDCVKKETNIRYAKELLSKGINPPFTPSDTLYNFSPSDTLYNF